MIHQLYSPVLALLTDLYQLTMAYAYWKSGKEDEIGVFHLYFRKNPFQGGFTVACGLSGVIDFLQNFHFTENDTAYLATLTGNDGNPLFSGEFLDYLQNLKFSCDVEAVPEGTVVFPNEPLLRITGPLLQCQLLETPLLNLINFQSLIATKSARIRLAAGSDTLLEFGLRRAQGIDGGVSASRAAYIGGFDATSNVLAGKLYGIPVKGTHAHSWVMSFESELAAFEAYADSLPNNVTLLVDTYDSIQGVKNAIKVGQRLREKGFDLSAIRLDSGDLAYLSIEARKLLDEAGFEKTGIVASNDLDENLMISLKNQGAQINIWGVRTKAVTAYDQPALGGVYKLSAILNESGWDYKLKLSEQAVKVSTPGIQQVRRFYNQNGFIADMIYNTEMPPPTEAIMIDPYDFTKKRSFEDSTSYEDLLTPIFEEGNLIYTVPTIVEVRERVQNQLAQFYKGIKRFSNPHVYPVGLEEQLFDMKTALIVALRQKEI